jgi:hypothetical protein
MARNASRKKIKSKLPRVVIVIKTFLSTEETHFPEKVKKAKEILTEAGFRPF